MSRDTHNYNGIVGVTVVLHARHSNMFFAKIKSLIAPSNPSRKIKSLLLTVTGAEVPVIEAVSVSAAVSVWLPKILSVAG